MHKDVLKQFGISSCQQHLGGIGKQHTSLQLLFVPSDWWSRGQASTLVVMVPSRGWDRHVIMSPQGEAWNSQQESIKQTNIQQVCRTTISLRFVPSDHFKVLTTRHSLVSRSACGMIDSLLQRFPLWSAEADDECLYLDEPRDRSRGEHNHG